MLCAWAREPLKGLDLNVGQQQFWFPQGTLKAYAAVEITEKPERSYECAYWKIRD